MRKISPYSDKIKATLGKIAESGLLASDFEELCDLIAQHGQYTWQEFPYKCAVVTACRLIYKTSQKNFAEVIGISKTIVEHWERGERVPKIENVYSALSVNNIPEDAIKNIIFKCLKS